MKLFSFKKWLNGRFTYLNLTLDIKELQEYKQEKLVLLLWDRHYH